MSRIKVSVTAILFLATTSQATTVIQKNYGYYVETAKDTGSDREYVVCDETRRSPLVPEPKTLPMAIRFGGQSTALPLHSTPAFVPQETLSRPCSAKYRLEKTILFGFDSARVEDSRVLSLLAGSLKTDPSVTGIRIRGFTCDIGTREYNDRLAMRRAVAVGSLLGKAGLQVDEVSGEGKCCYIPGERKLSRRVEISIMRSSRGENVDEK